jgi:hypothetical protein
MKFLNISFISLLKLYLIKEYNDKFKKFISEILMLHFKINKY